jgi:hypothetical protein
MNAMIQGTLVAVFLSATALAQTQAPPAPALAPEPTGAGAYNWPIRGGVMCGVGASESAVAVKPTAQCGAMFTFLPFIDTEVGVMGPQANRSPISGYWSTNVDLPLMQPSKVKRGLPLLVGGYTRMFETGNALDYGFAFARPIDFFHSIQFEARDYWVDANPTQHNVVFRIVWLIGDFDSK